MADTQPSGTYTLTGVTGSPITEEAAAGATVNYNIDGSADTFNLTADDGSAVSINQSSTSSDTYNLVADGGTIVLSADQTSDIFNVTIQNDGQFVTNALFGSTSSSGSLTFDDASGGGELVLGLSGQYKAATTHQVIYGFVSSNEDIDEQAVRYKTVTGYTISTNATTHQQTITINAGSGNYTFTSGSSTFADGTYAKSEGPLDLFRDGSGGTNISAVADPVACFLDNVTIATPCGDIAVQNLVAGDQVLVREHGVTVTRPVTWVGSRTVVLTDNASPDDYPVRVRQGAFADGVPHRDLLVTGEHCIHVDGRLIPVRMLVNGASIIIDRTITSFTFHHVELERHSVLIADGLEVESYLDTGNRAGFVSKSTLTLDSRPFTWNDAVAPLTIDRETVEPFFIRLASRATSLGFVAAPRNDLIQEPDIHLVTAAGMLIKPTLCENSVYAFVIPSDAVEVRLTSRASRPSETVGPFLDDRRLLGICVGRVGLGQECKRRILSDAHLRAPVLSGWHDIEGTRRWTNGNAILPIETSLTDGGSIFLDIEVLAAGPYLAEKTTAGVHLAA